MTVLLCNRNVCACLSSICDGICFVLCSVSVCQYLASTHFKCYFYLNTKWGLARRPISVCKVCLVLSASFRWQIIFIKTAHKDDCQTHDRCVLAPIINDCPLKSHYCILLSQKKRGSTPSGQVDAHIKITWAKSQGQCERCLPWSIFHKVRDPVMFDDHGQESRLRSQDTQCVLDGSPICELELRVTDETLWI